LALRRTEPRRDESGFRGSAGGTAEWDVLREKFYDAANRRKLASAPHPPLHHQFKKNPRNCSRRWLFRPHDTNIKGNSKNRNQFHCCLFPIPIFAIYAVNLRLSRAYARGSVVACPKLPSPGLRNRHLCRGSIRLGTHGTMGTDRAMTVSAPALSQQDRFTRKLANADQPNEVAATSAPRPQTPGRLRRSTAARWAIPCDVPKSLRARRSYRPPKS